jgi:hypothetical protein
MPSNNAQGYMYVATGQKYLAEALVSAASLRRINNDVHITLVTDQPINNSLFDKVVIEPFKSENPGDGYLYKVKHIYNSSPYQNTLFIDTDTYFCDDCQSLFEVLDFFDVAIAPDPTDIWRPLSPINNQRLKSFSAYNTGVILFKKNNNNEVLFSNWLKIFSKKVTSQFLNRETDQTSLIEAWLESDSKIYVLSHDWNARTPYFFTLNKSVKIIHGRHKDYELVKRKLNQPEPQEQRCWLPFEQRCVVNFSRRKALAYRLKHLTQYMQGILRV